MAVSTISRRQLCAEAATRMLGLARGVHSEFWLDAKESSHIYGESHGVLGDVEGKAGCLVRLGYGRAARAARGHGDGHAPVNEAEWLGQDVSK